MRFCYFDLETRLLASELGPDDQGWDKLKRGEGGISILAIYDTQENWLYTYDDHNLEDIAAHLESADVVIGFKSLTFDLPIVEGLLGRKLNIKKHIDIFEWISLTLARGMHKTRRGEYTLNAVCTRTIGKKKIDSGEHAPQLARDGKWGRLTNYCMQDVKLTRDLHNHIMAEGGIISAQGTFLPMEINDGNVKSNTASVPTDA